MALYSKYEVNILDRIVRLKYVLKYEGLGAFGEGLEQCEQQVATPPFLRLLSSRFAHGNHL